MKGFFTAFVRNRVFANIVLLFFFVGGGIAAVSMSRETFPDISLDMITVIVRWPGADPEEVEEGICRKVEEALVGVEGIKRVSTIAYEHFGLGRIEVHENADMELVKERVRNRVDVIDTFPEDAERPIIEEVVQKVQVLFVALASHEATERDLKEWGELITEEIRQLPEVSQVELMGTRDYEIGIEVPEEKLRQYGLSFDQVAQAVRMNSLNLPGGLLRTEGEEIRLRTMGRRYTAKDYAGIIVVQRATGEHITLGQIAAIRDDFVENHVISRFNGMPAITIAVLKTQEEDSLAIDRVVMDYVARKRAELPDSVELLTWGRFAPLLEKRINLLVRNGLIGLTLVFILMWFFLDIRLSFWAGMGMPVSVAGALIIMWGAGATINMISLFGLITVLGIIVDDAIVVGEAIYVARKNGAPPVQAAVDGVMEVGMPVVAAVTTTIVAFVPLFFVAGFMGKIIAILPVVVIACLAISLVECLILLPAHLNHLPTPGPASGRGKNIVVRFGLRFHRYTNEGLEWFVEHVYLPFIGLALRWRYVSVCVAIAVVLMTWGLFDSGILKFEFFPTMDGNSMTCTLEMPNGTPLETTRQTIERVENAIRHLSDTVPTGSGEPLLNNAFALAGAKIDERGDTERGTHFGSVRVELLDSSRRNIHTNDLMAMWEEAIGQIPGVVALTFRGDEIAPPGRPIEVWLQGNDMEQLTAASQEFKAQLSTYAGVYQIQDDFREGKNEIKLHLKDEARMLGINVADLARQVYAGYFGQEAVRIQRGRDDVRVRVRYPAEERRTVAELQDIRIRIPAAPMGAMGMPPGMGMGAAGMGMMGAAPAGAAYREVPLVSVADIEYGSGYASIQRTDGKRRIRVTAEVNSATANATEIVQELQTAYFLALREKYPRVEMSFQGEQQNIRESIESLMLGFPLAIVGIYIIIATIFRSYIQPMVIMVTVPFGACGAIFGHLLLGLDLSMISVFGMVALAGVVVNDAIVLIECINAYLASGEGFFESVRRGGGRRFRPIFLTTITTVGGLTPLIIEKDFQAQMMIPMAVSLASGVAFATLLTLMVVPCLLCIMNDMRRGLYWLATGTLPSPEEVEPARLRYVDEPMAPRPETQAVP